MIEAGDLLAVGVADYLIPRPAAHFICRHHALAAVVVPAGLAAKRFDLPCAVVGWDGLRNEVAAVVA
jgi:hypothetical protein